MSRRSDAYYNIAVGKLVDILDESETPIPRATLQAIFPDIDIGTLKKRAKRNGRVILGTNAGQAVPSRMTPQEFEYVVKHCTASQIAHIQIMSTCAKSIKGQKARLQIEDGEGFEALMDAVDDALEKTITAEQELLAAKVEIGLLLDRYFGDSPQLTDGEE